MTEENLIKIMNKFVAGYKDNLKKQNNNDVKITRSKLVYDSFWHDYNTLITINWISKFERRIRNLHFIVDDEVRQLDKDLKYEDFVFDCQQKPGTNYVKVIVSLK